MSQNAQEPKHERPDPNLPGAPARRRFGVEWTTERLIRIAIAVALIVVSLFTDRQFLVWGLIASLAVVLIPTGRARYFVAGIVPYATAWFVFSFLRSFADETVLAKTINLQVLDFERWLFDGEIPSIRLQAAFYDQGHIHPWDFYFTFVHWSYFIIPHAVALWIWWKNKREFQHFLAAMAMTLFMGLVIYFVIPANPPWMAPEALDTPGAPYVERIMGRIAEQIGGGLYQAGYKIVGESNPIAAMPSMHFAITFMLVWIARGKGVGWEIAAWIYSISMGLALVYMGEHYVIDVVIGGSVTTYSWFATRNWMNRFAADPETVEIAETPPDELPASA